MMKKEVPSLAMGCGIGFEKPGRRFIMNYIGVDYHKHYSHVTVVDDQGSVLRSGRVTNEENDLEEFLGGLDGPSHAVVEASRTWGVMYDLLEAIDGIASVTLAHPYKVRAIASAKIKTDAIDAGTLAQLLRANLIPAAYAPTKEARSLREMVRQRIFLVRLRTRVKNRIHTVLDRNHLAVPAVADLFGKRGTHYLQGVQLKGVDGEILRECLALMEQLNGLVRTTEKELGELLGNDPRMQLLLSIPGIGNILAATVALEIDTIGRFSSPGKLAAYCGLVPSTFSSGGKTFHGRLLRHCNRWLKWAFIEAAWAALRSSPYCRSFYERIKRRKGAPTAAAALARRLAEITWHVLTERRPYEERPYQLRHVHVRKVPASAALITV
jgi:transposase